MADVRAFDVNDVPLVPVAVRCFLQGGNALDVVNAFVGAFATSADATSPQGQAAFLDMLQHPIACAYPLRAGYTIAVARAYMKLCEAAFEAQRINGMSSSSSSSSAQQCDGDEADEELPSAVSDDLVEWYAEAQSGASTAVIVRQNPLSFRSFSVGNPSASSAVLNKNAASQRHPAAGEMVPQPLPLDEPKHWVHVAVGGQFTNVGLSLWPSAYVLLQVLQGALCDCSSPIAKSAIACPSGPFPLELRNLLARRVCMVELGAGVGLTSVVLQKWLQLGWLRKGLEVDVVLTDYQDGILENAQRNVHAAATSVSAFCEKDAAATVRTHTALLDWTEERRVKEAVFAPWDTDVILAADCIYDVDVIDGLLHTIHIGLEVAAARRLRRIEEKAARQQRADGLEGEEASVEGNEAPFALVVQTHRQHSTMQRFFVGASKFADVTSWKLSTAHGTNCTTDGDKEYFLEKLPSALWIHEGDNESRCSLAPCLIGPFLVEMAGLVCVHKITLNKQRATSSPPPLPPSAMQP